MAKIKIPGSAIASIKILALLLSSLGLFLSAWIVVPAPNMTLLPLSVGAPEISPWLLILNAIALLLSRIGNRRHRLNRITLITSTIALFLSFLPLLQLPFADRQIASAMRETLGANYLEEIPNEVQIKLRSQPFSFVDALTGIHLDRVRYTPDIQFANPDGVPLKMDIYRPEKVGTYPSIVVIYGGAWQRGEPTQNANFSRYMAARGYTVFAIAYRHAPRYRFPAQLQDVQSAIAFIRQHASEYEADRDRIALIGRSAGAHLAGLAAYQPDAAPVRAVVNYYGPVNLTKGYADPPRPDPIDVRDVLRKFLGGTPDELPQLYRQASPINYVGRPLPPTLLVYGRGDRIVQSKFGRAMYERLIDAGNKAIFLEIPWAEHAFDAIFQGPSNQLALYYTERFLAWALRS